MPINYEQKKPRKPLACLFSQIQEKPKFFYFSPIQIEDDDFPQQFPEQSYIGQFSSNLQSSFGSQQTYYDISNIKQVALLKFNKATFVKMKNKNYSKYYKTIVNCIGKGAFGTVRKVQSLISKQFRAAKILRKNTMKQDELEKLLVQVYIMMELDHPNIANILQVYDYKNEFTLICQLCQGGDLLKYTKSTKKKNQQKFVGIIIKQLLRTIIYLHNIGVVHRDIKPQNILFQRNDSPNIKLIDFGIATKIEPGQILTTRIGTPAYMAPQIVYQKYTEKVDVWATGITMYHLLSGKIPFRGESIKDIMYSIVKNQIPFEGQFWKEISPQCIQVIRLMTCKNYHERPSAKEIFEHPYFRKIKEFNLAQTQQAQFAQNIRKFQFKNKLQAAIQTFIASQLLSMQEKNELVDFFRQFDKDNDGVISTEQLKMALQKRKKLSAERIETLMDIIDTNGSGKIDYTEFLAAGFLDAKSFTIDRLKQAFAHFDTNDNGRISFEEVMEFMEDFQQSEDEVQKIFKEFDVNNDGSISQDEFINLMLERSKHMNLSKLKQSKQESEAEIRIDKLSLDNICFNFAIPRGQTAVFFQNLTNSKRKSMQKVNLFQNLI